MFNTGSKTISSFTMRGELKELGLNSCVATRKPLFCDINRKKSCTLPSNIIIGLFSSGERSCGPMKPDLPSFKTIDALEKGERHTKHWTLPALCQLFKSQKEMLRTGDVCVWLDKVHRYYVATKLNLLIMCKYWSFDSINGFFFPGANMRFKMTMPEFIEPR